MPKKPDKKPPADSRRYPERPIPAIGIVIWRGDQVLLIRRSKPPWEGEWGLPGGMQQLGETIIEAALREAREETGLDVEPLGIITALDGIMHDAKGKVEFHYTIIDVAAESREGEAEARDDAHEVRWATLDEVERLCGWPEVARVVRLSALQRVL
ncbi:MAG: NUDIX hydrolase [Alphaproteobacteria bacterium]|nr:NUDIX hydrolase [Alphaproteobacteria bacterium]